MIDKYLISHILDMHQIENLFVDRKANSNGACGVCGKFSVNMPGLADRTKTYDTKSRIDRICSKKCLEYLKLVCC